MYGPTIGPPSPTGAAPAGWTESVEVSRDGAREVQPPVPGLLAAVPAASAFRASRADDDAIRGAGSAARSSAAAAATSAEEADVPVIDVVPPPAASVTMSVPGAPRNVSAP